MGQVSVTIAGKAFRMACDDGEEPHLEGLARTVDRKIGELRDAFGEIGDLRLTVMAAISMADDAVEQANKLAALEADVAALKEAQGAWRTETSAADSELVALIDRLTDRVDGIVRVVEGREEEEEEP